jgi:hypothetical protein
MPRKIAETLPEVFVSDSGKSPQVSRLRRGGRLRKLGPRLYTTNLDNPPEDIILRNLWQIVAKLAPGGVVSHRTALEMKPSPGGVVFITGKADKTIKLPGLIIRLIKGPGALPGDTAYIGGLRLASRARAFLENLQPSRRRDLVAKTVGRKEIEARLVGIARIHDLGELNKLRDRARKIAKALGAEAEFAVLDDIIGALHRTRTARLSAPEALAIAVGKGYDPDRVPLFAALHAALRTAVPRDRPVAQTQDQAFRNAAFFDAYFSNYIEGTRFEVGEAIDIVFNNVIPERRPADAHDVLGTYQIVGSLADMTRVPGSFDEFARLLKERHRKIMSARPDMEPGMFKTKPNQAGATMFVAPLLVRGTLEQGWQFHRSLDRPFDRALFIMFLIAEVHPFNDGNGRVARTMMNAELIAAGQCRIFIPSVYRNEYVGSLKRLTNHGDASAFIRVMDAAQDFVSRIDFAGLDSAQAVLAACNAFKDPGEDVKLLMPVTAV